MRFFRELCKFLNIFVIFAHFAILVMTHALARSVFDSMLGQIFQKIPHLMRLRHNIYTKSVLRLDYVMSQKEQEQEQQQQHLRSMDPRCSRSKIARAEMG